MGPPEGGMSGVAPGYTEAMHGLCVGCHEKKTRKEPAKFGRWFEECSNCHRDTSKSDLEAMAPYVEAPQAR